MADRKRNSLLSIATILLILTTVEKGANGQCSTPLENVVVLEGANNTMLGCAAGSNYTAWSVRPASNASRIYQITGFNETVTDSLKLLYAINQSGLIVLQATTTQIDGPISTAGVYLVKFANTTTTAAAKLVVLRSVPTCKCIELASDAVNITCNVIYADHPVAPILPIVNCTANGQFYATDKPIRILDNPNSTLYVYNSTSTITINNTALTTYQCQVTFSAPTTGAPAYLAKNAPNYSINFTLCEGPSTTPQPTTTTTVISSTTQRMTSTSQVATSTKLSSTTTQYSTMSKQTTQLSTTTAQPPTTSVKPQTTTAVLLSTTTKSSPTTTQPPTASIQTSVASRIPTVSTQLTTTTQPSTASILLTTTIPASTTTAATATTPYMTTTKPSTTTQQVTASSEVGPSSTSAELSTESTAIATTLTQSSTSSAQLTSTSTQITTTSSSNEIDLLTLLKIILGTILGILLAALVAVGCSWCFFYCCPPLLPFRRPTRFIDNEIQIFPRRDWIPARRDICLTEYWNIPFYRQSFSRYRTPNEYRLPSRYQTPCEYRLPSKYPTTYESRLPSRCRCVQSCVTQSPPQECRCGQKPQTKAYCVL